MLGNPRAQVPSRLILPDVEDEIISAGVITVDVTDLEPIYGILLTPAVRVRAEFEFIFPRQLDKSAGGRARLLPPLKLSGVLRGLVHTCADTFCTNVALLIRFGFSITCKRNF